MQSKLQGEKNIQNNFKPSVFLRPSVLVVPEDKFFNTFASIAQFSPGLPLVGGGKTKFAPIYVGDVAKAIVKALELNNSEPKDSQYEELDLIVYNLKIRIVMEKTTKSSIPHRSLINN